MPATPLKTKTACDQCRFRKLKCDGAFPCGRCSRMEFECSFNAQSTRNRRIEQLRGRHGQISPPVTGSDRDVDGRDKTTSPESSHSDSGGRNLLKYDPNLQNGRAGLREIANRFQDSHDPSSQAVQWPSGNSSQATSSREVPFNLFRGSGIAIGDTARRNSATTVQRWPTLDSRGHLPQDHETANGASFRDQESRSPLDIPTVGPDPFGASPSASTTLTRGAFFTESEVLPWLDIFFARLSSTLPIVDHLA